MDPSSLTRSVWTVRADEFPADAPIEDQAAFLLRYAILAPSSHNSQPWQFAVEGNAIEIRADEDRWLEVADPDGRELLLSVGCAVENCRIAAERFGFDCGVAYRTTDDDVTVVVTLEPGGGPPGERPSALFDAITERSTSHQVFDDRPIPPSTADRLRSAVLEDDVTLLLVEDLDRRWSVGQLQFEADRDLMDDPAYRKELGRWLGSGALGDDWLVSRLGQLVVTHLDVGDREGQKNSKLIRSAPAVGVLVTAADDPVTRVRVGQTFQRLALVAAVEGVAVHPMSQTLERPGPRDRLADCLGIEAGVPQHLFRLGYADEEGDHTPRWPLETFLSTDH